MNKKAKVIHFCVMGVGWLLFAWQIVYFLLHLGDLPDECGIHFTPNGEFDVQASKYYGFYPHIITLIMLVIDLIFSVIVGREKLKLGLKVTERGKMMIISSIVITLDIMFVGTALFFSFWVYAVSNQYPAIMDIPPTYIIRIITLLLIAAIIFQLAANSKYKLRTEADENISDKEKKKRRIRFLLTGSTGNSDSGVSHRLSRAASWIIVVVLTAIILFILDRLPAGDIADEHHGKAWFENLGGYYDKWLVFLPFIVSVPIMLICEAVSVKANKKGNKPLVSLCDRIKLTLAVFSGWCLLLLGNEAAVDLVTVIVFAVFIAVCVIRFVIERKSFSKQGSD